MRLLLYTFIAGILLSGVAFGQLGSDLFQLPESPASRVPPEFQSARELFSEQAPSMAVPGKSRAILSSLLFPGTGERMLQADERGVLFTGTEIGLWLGYVGFRLYSGWREDDYQAYATQYAGVRGTNKDEQYWIDVGTYDNLDKFNEQRLRERSIEDVYPDQPAYRWDWDSYAHQLRFDQMRIQSRRAAKLASFTLGAVVLNHIVSALDVTYLYNARIQVGSGEVSYLVEVPLR